MLYAIMLYKIYKVHVLTGLHQSYTEKLTGPAEGVKSINKLKTCYL